MGTGCRRLFFGLLLLPLSHDPRLLGEPSLPLRAEIKERDAGGRRHERHHHRQRGRRRCTMPPSEPHQRFRGRRWPGKDRLTGEPATEFGLHLDGGRVAAPGLLFETRGDDRGQRAGIDGCAPRPPRDPLDGRRRHGSRIVEDSRGLHERHAAQVVRQTPRQHLVQHEAQGVHVAPRIHVAVAHAELLGAHVSQRAHDIAGPRHLRGIAVVRIDRTRNAEVDHLGFTGGIHEDIAGLEVAVDHSFLMAVSHGSTDAAKERHDLADAEAGLVGVPRDRPGRLDHLHDEKRHLASAVVVGPKREDLGDIGMPEPREHAGLVLKSADERCRREPVPQHLDSDATFGRGLLSLVDTAHPSLGDHPDDRHATEIGARRQGAAPPRDRGCRRPEPEMLIGATEAGVIRRRGILRRHRGVVARTGVGHVGTHAAVIPGGGRDTWRRPRYPAAAEIPGGGRDTRGGGSASAWATPPASGGLRPSCRRTAGAEYPAPRRSAGSDHCLGEAALCISPRAAASVADEPVRPE